jgi:hypothetical protein
MITSRDPRHLMFAALLCVYALTVPTPALAASMLSADASGFATAGADLGSPDKQITPGAGVTTVTFGDAASDNIASGIALSAGALGAGEARFGALAGHARAEASSAPPSPHLAAGEARLFLGFLDTAEIVSSTLAPGTPVTLTFVMTLDAMAFHSGNGLFVPSRIGAFARGDAVISDIEAGTSTPPVGPIPSTIVQSVGSNVPQKTLQFDTVVGHHLVFDVDLEVAASVRILCCEAGPTSASQGAAEVLADHTARFFYQPLDDVSLVSESGRNYALAGPGGAPVPEPASLTLLGVGGAALLAATRRLSRARRPCVRS